MNPLFLCLRDGLALLAAVLGLPTMTLARFANVAGHPDLLFHGIGYQVRSTSGQAIVIAIIAGHLPVPQAIDYQGRAFVVNTMDVVYCAAALDCLVVPQHILAIEGRSFLGSRIRTILFPACASLRAIHGFQCCPVERLYLPASVELLGPDAFADCRRLRLLSFEEDSRIREVNGFQRTALRALVFPANLRVIGRNAFVGCDDLCQVQVREPSALTSIFVPRCGILVLPDFRATAFPRMIKQASNGTFLQYPTSWIGHCRRSFALKRDVIQICASPSPEHDVIKPWGRYASWSALPIIPNPGDVRPDTLSLRLRFPDGELPFAGRPHTYIFVTMSLPSSTTVSLASVLAMLTASPSFACLPGRHSQGTHCIFHVVCSRCGPTCSLLVHCPFSGQGLKISTRTCCGHFFVGRLIHMNRSMGTTYVAQGHINQDARYNSHHAVRTIARTLLHSHASGQLEPAERSLLHIWVESPKMYAGLSLRRHTASFEQLLEALPGRFVVTVSGRSLAFPGLSCPVLFNGQPVVTLTWIAPWAADALRRADYYELDCSFQALRPFVYSVPMVISRNVGIPIGLVVAPTERARVFALFAEGLVEHGVCSRQSLASLPLLSDAGRALAKYVRDFNHRHFLCYRHLLEILGSGTLVAILAARLFFAVTRQAFLDILPQTLSDFALGCRDGLITVKGRGKFAELFGLDLNDWNMDTRPFCNVDVFARQAFWGERGALGVSSCSNHLEGLHGRLNRRVSGMKNWPRRFAEVLDALQSSARAWPEKVRKAQLRAKTQLLEIAAKHSFTYSECPLGANCDHGALLSRRFGVSFPCVHLAATHCWDISDVGELPTTLNHEGIQCREAGKPWPFKQEHARPPPIVELPSETDIAVDLNENTRYVKRVLGEMQSLGHGVPFPHSLAEMNYQLGRVHEMVKHTVGREMATADRRIYANSKFLMMCVRVVKERQPWSFTEEINRIN